MRGLIRQHLLASVLCTLLLVVLVMRLYASSSQPSMSFWHYAAVAFCVLFIAWGLMTLANKFALLPERSFWPMLGYVAVVTAYPMSFALLLPYLATVLAFFVMNYLLLSAAVRGPKGASFMVAFFLTGAALLYPPMLLFFIPYIFIFLRIAKASLREIVSFLGGMVSLLFISCGIVLLAEKPLDSFLLRLVQPVLDWQWNVRFTLLPLGEGVVTGFLLLLSLAAFVVRWLRSDNVATLIQARFYEAAFVMLLAVLLVVAGLPEARLALAPLLSVPVSVMVVTLFAETKGLFSTIVFYLLVALLVARAALLPYIDSLPFCY